MQCTSRCSGCAYGCPVREAAAAGAAHGSARRWMRTVRTGVVRTTRACAALQMRADRVRCVQGETWGTGNQAKLPQSARLCRVEAHNRGGGRWRPTSAWVARGYGAARQDARELREEHTILT